MAAGDVVYAQGFEVGSATYEPFFATTTGGTVTVSSTQAKNGTYSIRVNRTSAAAVSAYWDWSGTNVPNLGGTANPTTLHVSFWLYVAARPSTGTIQLWRMQTAAATDEYQLLMDSSGNVTMQFSTEAISQTVASALSTGAWHQFECGFDVSTGTRAMRCRIDGGTAQTRTVSRTASTISGIYVGTNETVAGTFDYYFDDMVLVEGYSAWPGNLQNKALRPNGDVDSNWTITGGDATRAAATDDVPPDTTKYIGSATNGQIQRVDLGTYTFATYETCVATSAFGVMGGNGTTARNAVVRFQNSAGTDHATTATWNANVSGWQKNTSAYTVITAPGGGAISQSVLDGLRFKWTKSADTRQVNCADVVVYATIKYTPPIAQTLTATLSFTSAQTRLKKVMKTLSATASFTSAQTKKVKATDTATLSFTTARTKKVKATDTAALSFTSAQTKKAKAAKTGVLSFTSAQTRRTAFRKALTATLAFTSAQTRKAKAIKTATLAFTSAQTRKAKKTLTASWSSTGALTRRTAYRKALTGALSFTSAQVRKVRKPFTATLSHNGAITRRVRVAYAAAGSFTGSLLKKVRKTLTASLSFSGSNSQTPVGGPPPASSDANYGWFIRWRRRRHED